MKQFDCFHFSPLCLLHSSVLLLFTANTSLAFSSRQETETGLFKPIVALQLSDTRTVTGSDKSLRMNGGLVHYWRPRDHTPSEVRFTLPNRSVGNIIAGLVHRWRSFCSVTVKLGGRNGIGTCTLSAAAVHGALIRTPRFSLCLGCQPCLTRLSDRPPRLLIFLPNRQSCASERIVSDARCCMIN